MSDKKRLLSNIVWLLFDKILLLILNFVIILVVANHYGATKYGIFQYAANIVLILEVIVQLMDGRVVKKLYNEDNYEEVVLNVTIGKVFLSSIALIIGFIVAFVSSKGEEFKIILLILLLDSIIKNLRFGMENRFEYNLQSKKIVIASNIGLSMGLLCQIIAVYANWSIIAIAIIQMMATTVSLVVLKHQYNKRFKPRKKPYVIDYQLMREIIIESTPLAIAAAASVIYMRCDSVMLGTMLSTTEVGIYSISAKLISALQLLIAPIQTSIYIKMIEWYGTDTYEKKYINITAICTWIAIVGVFCSFFVLPFVFKLLKPEYLPALESFRILTFGSIFAYNAILRSSHITLTQNARILMISQVVTVVLNIILNYYFIKKWGMNGAAFATAFSQCASLFVSNIFFKDARFIFIAQFKAFNPSNILRK